MVADNKKCQTLINVVATCVNDLQVLSGKLQRCRQAYQDQNVDPVGTPLDGNIPAVTGWIDDVVSVADSPVANGFLQHIVEGHENNALGEI